MKHRKGFVSNSSSSSFICDHCGQEYSGWDACLDEAEMIKCENGHTICQGHIDNFYDILHDLEKNGDSYEARYNFPKKYCPICSFETIIDSDAVKYLLKRSDMSIGDMKTDIQTNFNSYDEFKQFINS